MRYINTKLKFRKINPADVKSSKEYSEGLTEKKSSYHQSKSGIKRDRFEQFHYQGKLSEFVFSDDLTEKGIVHSAPDCLIYDHNGFDVDIKTKEYNIHVKSYDVNSRWGESYTFELSDPVLKAAKSNDLVAFVVLSTELEMGAVRCVLPISEIKFRPPLYQGYRHIKTCAYISDILEIKENENS